MTLHPRTVITMQAGIDFAISVACSFVFSEPSTPIRISELLRAYGALLANVGSEWTDSPVHEKLEDVLKEVKAKYELTDGEVARLLSSQIAIDSRRLLRYERHGNYETHEDEEPRGKIEFTINLNKQEEKEDNG